MADNNGINIDNDAQIDSVLDYDAQIDSDLGNIVEVTIAYIGSENEDTITGIDPTTHAISVTIKPTWVESTEALPETGSANVIYGIKSEQKLAVWDSANSEYIFFGYVLTATEKTKLGTLIEMLDNDQFGNVDDVKVDNTSVVDANKIAQFLTINGNYNASTNKLATESDLPTNTSDLTNDGDGESPFATEAYVEQNGGKIDSISVNNTQQTIDANKNVNITVPTQASDIHALPDSTKYGANLSVSGTTVQLQDQDGNSLGSAISTQDTGATSIETTGAGNAVTSASYDATSRKITLTKGTEFQTATDNSLDTTAKNVVSAINEVNAVAKNANIAKGFTSYQALITELNSVGATAYKVGQSFYVQTQEVPDLWVISIESTSSSYTYTTDSAFIAATGASGGQQVGYYKLAQLETQKVDLSNYVQKTTTIAGVDLQDNITKGELQTALNVADGAQVNTIESVSAGGTTLTPDANKNVNIPYASANAGVVKVSNSLGMGMTSAGILYPLSASTSQIDEKTQSYNSLTPSNLNYAVKSALSANNHLTMTSSEQDTAQSVLGVDVLTGSGAPTTSTVGRLWQIYIDTNTTKKTAYQCTSITEDTSTTPSTFTYTWVKLIRINDTASDSDYGVVKLGNTIYVGSGGVLAAGSLSANGYNNAASTVFISKSTLNNIRSNYVKEGVTANTNTLTSAEKTAAKSWLGVEDIDYGIMRWDE